MLFNWYLILCQGFFSNTVMNWVASSYKIGLFLLLQIYIFTKGASHPPFIHPVALLQCKKHLDQVVPSKWIPGQWMLGHVPLNIREEYAQNPLGQQKMSFLQFSQFSGGAEKMPLLFYFLMFHSCSAEEKQERESFAWVGLAEKYCGSLQTMCTGASWRIFLVGYRKEKDRHENDFYREPY